MSKRKISNEKPEPPAHWDISETFLIDGKTEICSGEECKIKNDQGTYKFLRFVVNTKIKNHEGWVDLYGGPANYGSFRSVKPNMIKAIPKKRQKK